MMTDQEGKKTNYRVYVLGHIYVVVQFFFSTIFSELVQNTLNWYNCNCTGLYCLYNCLKKGFSFFWGVVKKTGAWFFWGV